MTKISRIEDIDLITQDELKEILHYDPDTGNWTWLQARSNKIKIGSRAGCIRKSDGYRGIKLFEKDYLEHRLAYLYMTGSMPDNDIDHKDRNKTNNKWKNLRPATKAQNASNRPGKLRKYNLPRGVTIEKRNTLRPYVVKCGGDKIGSYSTMEEASVAYQQAAKERYGEFVYHGD